MARTAIARVLGAASALLLGAAAALAQSVHEVVPGGDVVTGSVGAAGEVDRVPVRLVEGAAFSLSLKAAKGSLLLPDLVILGPDRQPDGTVAGFLKANSKGNALALKNLPVPATGLRWIEIRGKSGTTGGWTLTTKVKLPKGAAGTPTIAAAQGVTSFSFPVPGNATTTLVVAAARGSLAHPAFGGLADPAGAPILVDGPIPGKTGFSLQNVYLAKPGTYTLTLQPGTGGDGAVAVTVKWKIPKPVKRALLESQVITDPVVTAVSPAGGNNSQVVSVVVTVDFARPGAKVLFRKPPTVVTAQGAGLSVGPSSITFLQNLASFQKGDYDVEVENPDGGKAGLPKAFNVVNAPATLTGVVPNFGYDNQSAIQVVVSGSFINGGATAALVRGGETIPGTGVTAASSTLTATFDLRGTAIGFFDVVVTNPDAAPTALASAFEIRNSPPLVTALSPNHNLDSAVVNCTIDGSDFDATPTVSLRKSGQADIPGTSVVWVNGGQIACTFNTAGAPLGTWDLRVANPDLNSATLPGAFRVSGVVAPAAKILSPVNTADGPPSICWNGTRNEFAVAWVDESAGSFDVWIQRLDSKGSPVASKIAVSTSGASVAKRDAVVAWNSTNDEYLVCWCEPRALPSSVTSKHPSGNPTFLPSVSQVLAQRFQGSDLGAVGANTQVSDHTALANSSGYYMDEFNNYRPDACWDAKSGLWQIVWLQEWDTRGSSSYDDWDIIQQSLNPSDGKLLPNPISVATSQYHEGDPSIAYDPVNQRVVRAWNYRMGTSSVLSGIVEGGSITADSADTQDLRLAVDPDGKRILATWTKSPGTGAKYVEGVTLDLASPGSKIGSVVTIGSGTEDHFFARPVYNGALKESLVAWSRKDGSGGLTVRSRRATTGTSSGLVLIGSEQVTSSGSTDEAIPVTVYSGTAGESVVLWLKTMSFATVNGYAGSAFPGIYRGKEFWLVRYR